MRHCSGMCSSLTLPCASTMCPLQRPRPSPPADAGIRLLCPVPVTSGRTGAAACGGGGKFKNFKKCHFFFFTFYICFVLRSACILSVLS
ncbi:unnamed protein product, partial [Staurois parvus]